MHSAEYQKQNRYSRGKSGGLLYQKLETDLETGEQKCCHGRKRIERRLQDITRRLQCCGLLHWLTGRCCVCCFPFQIIKDEAQRYIFEQTPPSWNGKMPLKTSGAKNIMRDQTAHAHLIIVFEKSTSTCFILY